MRSVLGPLGAALAAEGGGLVALGGAPDFAAYDDVLGGARRVRVPGWAWHPAMNALWHLARAGAAAKGAGADVLLLPAANRRLTAVSPLPTVAVIHDLANLHVPGKYDPLRMAYLRHVMLGALTTADVIVAISAATRDDLERALGGRRQVRVVPNGVDARRFTPRPPTDPEVVAARARARLDRPYLLYPSRLEHPGKNHLRLLRAFAASSARATHLLALSGADWGAQAAIEDERARLGLGDAVRILGWLADADVPRLVAGADAVVMAGLHEGFGLPALEALAAGRPVAVSSTGALPEVVGPLGVLFDPLDEGAIARALERVTTDRALGERARRQGPPWAAARSWDRTAAGLAEACRDARRSHQ